MNIEKPNWTAGVARRKITPPMGVELAGLGYYLKRAAERVRDDLNATALVIGDGKGECVAVVALDLMYNDAAFTRTIRQRVSARTSLRPEAICVNFSHTHNAPTAGFIRGGGEINANYLRFAIDEAAAALITAWKERRPASLRVGQGELAGMTFNRTRENGPVNTRVSVLRADALDGKPLAVVVNFHSHCTAHMEAELHAASRDWPGEVVDQIEAALPGATAMYWQGTCGDVNFRREYNGTERRSEPARAVAKTALEAWQGSRLIEAPGVRAAIQKIVLPTRRWTREEIARDREEGLHRLKTGDITDWLAGIARTMVNQPERLPLRYGGSVERTVSALSRFVVEWTEEILPVLDSRPETLDAEVQAMRIGDVWLAANPSELFTTLGLEIERRWMRSDLFMLSYANGSIGYLPDAHDVERRTYAAIQSPKFTGQFPFTAESGRVMVEGIIEVLDQVRE
jgi:neutral ceramidase